jgi:hypothetical protein
MRNQLEPIGEQRSDHHETVRLRARNTVRRYGRDDVKEVSVKPSWAAEDFLLRPTSGYGVGTRDEPPEGPKGHEPLAA